MNENDKGGLTTARTVALDAALKVAMHVRHDKAPSASSIVEDAKAFEAFMLNKEED